MRTGIGLDTGVPARATRLQSFTLLEVVEEAQEALLAYYDAILQ